MAGFIQAVFDRATVDYFSDSRRIVLRDVPGLGDIPLGRKIQNPGPRCRPWRHKWDIYPGIRQEYVDKVCGICDRRKQLN